MPFCTLPPGRRTAPGRTTPDPGLSLPWPPSSTAGPSPHCIAPFEAIYERDWRTGTHIATRFSAADGGTLGVAGLWQPLKSPEGEWVNNCTMLTLNADNHD